MVQGVKIRSIICNETELSSILWPLPTNPNKRHKTVITQKQPGHLYAAPLIINGSNTTGYCVGFRGTTVSIMPQTTDAFNPMLMPRLEPTSKLYLPINPGEWVKEVWLWKWGRIFGEAIFIVSIAL